MIASIEHLNGNQGLTPLLRKMDSILLLLMAVLSVSRSVTSSPIEASCEDGLHTMCPFNDLHDSFNEDSFSILHEETLSKYCKDIIEDIECKKNFLSRCNPDEVESFSLVTDGVKNVLVDVCDNTTDTRKAYRTHSPCIANMQDDYENCIINLSDSVEPEDYVTNGNDVTSKEAMIRRMCRFYKPFKRCVTEATRKQCGDSAAQLVEQLVVRMATPAVNTKCSPKDYS